MRENDGVTILQQAATAICEHLRVHHAAPDRRCVDVPGWQQRDEELKRHVVATGMLPQELGNYEGQSTWLPTPLHITDGQMRWWEEWYYPPPDLLLRLCVGLPIGPQGGLVVVLEQAGQQLLAIIPLVSREHWFDPRWHWAKIVHPFKQQHGGYFSQPEQIARHKQVPIVCAAAQTQVAEVLTQLVLLARHAAFPIAPDDDQSANAWIRAVMRSGLRAGGRKVSTLIGELYEALDKRFYWPAGPGGFQAFIQTTTKWLAQSARDKSTTQGSPGTWNDPESGVVRYSDDGAAQACGGSPRTVARWRKSQGLTQQGLSENQLDAFRRQRESKRQRAELRVLGAQRGLKPDAIKKIIYRGEKVGQSPEGIKAALERSAVRQQRREAATVEPLQDTLSIADQIAEWTARYEAAMLGSDEWFDAREAVEQLQRRLGDTQP